MQVSLKDLTENVYATDDIAERERMLRTRQEVYGLIVQTVREEMGFPPLPDDQLGERVDRMLVFWAVVDAATVNTQGN